MRVPLPRPQTQPWVVAFFMDCIDTGMRDWRNPEGGLGPEIIQCPNATVVAKFKAAVQRGDIFWHAFPHNAQPGTYEPSLFESSLQMGARLSDQLNVSRPVCFSQRDETGMTRAVLPLLNKHGVKMISLGSGGSSGGHPVIPDIFVWKDTATSASVLFVHDHGCRRPTNISITDLFVWKYTATSASASVLFGQFLVPLYY